MRHLQSIAQSSLSSDYSLPDFQVGVVLHALEWLFACSDLIGGSIQCVCGCVCVQGEGKGSRDPLDCLTTVRGCQQQRPAQAKCHTFLLSTHYASPACNSTPRELSQDGNNIAPEQERQLAAKRHRSGTTQVGVMMMMIIEVYIHREAPAKPHCLLNWPNPLVIM